MEIDYVGLVRGMKMRMIIISFIICHCVYNIDSLLVATCYLSFLLVFLSMMFMTLCEDNHLIMNFSLSSTSIGFDYLILQSIISCWSSMIFILRKELD